MGLGGNQSRHIPVCDQSARGPDNLRLTSFSPSGKLPGLPIPKQPLIAAVSPWWEKQKYSVQWWIVIYSSQGKFKAFAATKKEPEFSLPLEFRTGFSFLFFFFFGMEMKLGKMKNIFWRIDSVDTTFPVATACFFFFFTSPLTELDGRETNVTGRGCLSRFLNWENSQRGWETSSELNRSKIGGEHEKKTNLRREGEGDAHYGYELRPLLSTVFWVQEIVSWICRWQETNMKHLLCF